MIKPSVIRDTCILSAKCAKHCHSDKSAAMHTQYVHKQILANALTQLPASLLEAASAVALVNCPKVLCCCTGDIEQYTASLRALMKAILSAAAEVDAESVALPFLGAVKVAGWDGPSAKTVTSEVIEAASTLFAPHLKVPLVHGLHVVLGSSIMLTRLCTLLIHAFP